MVRLQFWVTLNWIYTTPHQPSDKTFWFWHCTQAKWSDFGIFSYNDWKYLVFWKKCTFEISVVFLKFFSIIWTASSEFGTYRLCEQRRFRRACASAQSRQNLRCSLIQAVSQEEPSDRKPDPCPFWMAGHAQLKFDDGMLEDTNSLDGTHIDNWWQVLAHFWVSLEIRQEKKTDVLDAVFRY